MSEEKKKLVKRIEHWAEHNDEHTIRFEETAKEAKNMGLTGATQYLIKAAEAGKQVSIHLRDALNKLNSS
jgi:hypothetical protein